MAVTPVRETAVLRLRREAGTGEVLLCSGAAVSFEGCRPWRPFRWRRGQAHYSGLYWSAVTGGHVGYESRLELAWLLLADREPGLRTIISQPFQLTAVIDGQRRRHVPDFLTIAADGAVTVVDVKPARRLADATVAFTFGWARRIVQAQGWRFQVASEPEATLLANVRFLAGYRRAWQFQSAVLDAITESVTAPATWSQVAHAATGLAGDRDRGRAHLLHLLWSGRLHVGLDEPLSETMVITPGWKAGTAWRV